MSEFHIHNQDVLSFLGDYSGPKFHFAFYDPPYGIGHIGKWDKSGVTYSPDLYNGIYNILHPGAFVISYGHSSTHHRIMVGFEDAGFILHKTLFAWVYFSGYPQGAANMQRNIDNHFAKKYGGICACDEDTVNKHGTTNVEGYVLDETKNQAIPVEICNNCSKAIRKIVTMVKWSKTAGMKKLGGPGYGNNQTQVIAESMTPEAELYKNYTYGAAWARPMLEPMVVAQKPFDTNTTIDGILKYNTGVVNVYEGRATNRWPGNFFMVHSAECVQQDGTWNCGEDCIPKQYMQDDPEFAAKAPQFQMDQTELMLNIAGSVVFDSKAQKAERDAGLQDPNPHSSVKPLSVNSYISKLFLPPERKAKRNVFVPFSGVGSEAIALGESGWDNITMCEISPEFCSIAEQRIAHYLPKAKTIVS